jgi:LexA-binding, inner membrane-associated putative hydrolase
MLLFAHVGLALAAGRMFRRTNLAFLALGSMLPDIIDKPLGQLVYGTPAMGRTFSHTLLFLLLISALALYLRDGRLASLSGGVLSHLILDSMWASPVILLWPLFGPFPQAAHMEAWPYLEMLLGRLSDPFILIPECLGLAEIIYLLLESRSSLAEKSRALLPKGQLTLAKGG